MVNITAGVRWTAVAALVAALAGPVAAQEPPGTDEGLLDTAVYLIKVGRFDEAAVMIQKILDGSPSPADALRLRNRAGYDFLAPLMTQEKLGPPVRELLRLAAEAIKANRTDVTYIKQMVGRLGTPQEPRAVYQLRLSGPYAIPVLVEALMDESQLAKRARLEMALTKMPGDAAPAMIEALRCPNVAVRAAVADALGIMNSRTALAELKRMSEDARLSEAVRTPVDLALKQILGRRLWSAEPAVVYYEQLVAAYHSRTDWAMPPGDSATVPVWTWDAKAGKLTYVEVPRTQVGPLMAERTAQRMIGYWPKYEHAYPLWYLAKLGKLWEAEARPEGGWSADDVRRDLTRLASVLGDARLIAGLKAAMDRRDWPAAVGFLQGLYGVARARTVRVDPTVVRAMSAPDRRAQFEAALVIAAADPQQRFEGDDLVVPILGAAVNQAMRREIVIVTPDLELVNQWRETIRGAGFTMHDLRKSKRGWEHIVGSPAVEMAILYPVLKDPTTEVLLRQIRTDPRTRSVPVLLLGRNDEEVEALRTGLARRYPFVGVLRTSALPESVPGTILKAITEARGKPILAAHAQTLAHRAAGALNAIGPRHPVFVLTAAVPQLESALEYGHDEVRIEACKGLAMVGGVRCQKALALAAANKDRSVEAVAAALSGLIEAIRREGNLLDHDQVAALVALTDRGDDTITALVARLIGVTGIGAEDLTGAYRRAGGS